MNLLSEPQTPSPQTSTSASPTQQPTSSFELLSSLNLSKTLHQPVEPRPNCCDICGRYFNRYDNLERHRRTHLNQKLFDCEECGKSFSQKSHLKEHSTVHTGDHPYKCHICGHAFSRKGNLSRHMKTHGRSTLPPSSSVTPTATLLSKVTSSIGDNSSNILGSSPEVQDQEEADVLVEDPDSLGVDSSNKSIISAFSRHHRRQHGDNILDINSDNPFGCKACWRAFSQASNSNRNKVHERIHTALKPYKCDICPKSFSQRSHLKVHRRIHTGEKPFTCPSCPFTFSRSDHLERHMRTHQGQKQYHVLGSSNHGNSSNSDQGGSEDAQNLNVNNDGQSTTSKSIPNGCSCSCKHNHENSSSNTDINSHNKNNNNTTSNNEQRFPTQNEHEESSSDGECEGDKPLDCSLCWKAFSQRSHESMHKKIHHAVLPFKCNVCGKAFPLNGSLIRHKRTHVGEKRFRCDICGKTFSQMSHVKVHQLIHGGNRPYKCDDCGYAFRRPDHLLRHKQANAGKKGLSCRPHHAGKSPNSNDKSKEPPREQHAIQAEPYHVNRGPPELAHMRPVKQPLENPSDQPLNLVGTVPLNLHSSSVNIPYYNPVSLASTLVNVQPEQANISQPTTHLPLGISHHHHHANIAHHVSFAHPSLAHSSVLPQHLNIPLHPNVAHSVNVPHHPGF